MRRTRRRAGGNAGFTYLGVLFLVSLLALTAGMASAVWATAQQREHERQLAFAGRQYQLAIERYRQQAHGAEAPYPREVAHLLRDPRVPGVRRFLRQPYVDPMTDKPEWGLVRLADGGIVGVHSLSSRTAIGGPPDSPGITGGRTYREWRFIAPSAVPLLGPAPAASGVTPRGEHS
ncbi:type II secretion system protein [Piscinibacter sp. HJYY11]|uniref:type II secretion system protein n=1 Tax=Piscinibacter sp. HJYY11 TaxID=2801333 RepID=UPI00191EA7B0|nr:type II secretion system protein [Piscinibacter sp. HJYY11]MBL0726179.1 type II secretion system protein [Piscinibacter sp. HJYY11]